MMSPTTGRRHPAQPAPALQPATQRAQHLARQQAQEWADAILLQRFAPGCTPRSAEYRAGVLAGLLSRALAYRPQQPHREGSAQADAWWAGLDEGQALWRQHGAERFP